MRSKKSRRTPDKRKRRTPAKVPHGKARVAKRVSGLTANKSPTRPSGLPRLTLREFAALLDRSPDTVSRWCANGMPHEQPGKANAGFEIDPAKALPWVLTYALEPPKESQRERLAREQADKVALDNANRRGELVDAVMVDQVLKALAVGIASQHKTITNRCAHEFASISDPQRIRERFTEEFATTGEALAALVGDLAAACERAAQDAAAAESEAAALAGSVGRREPDPAEGQRGAGQVSQLARAVDEVVHAGGSQP